MLTPEEKKDLDKMLKDEDFKFKCELDAIKIGRQNDILAFEDVDESYRQE